MTNPRTERWLWLIVVVMCILWIGTPFVNLAVAQGDFSKAGQLGDMYGLVNAGFSGLGAVGVFIALRLQTRELRAALDERSENMAYQKRVLTVGLHTEWHSERLNKARRECLLAVGLTQSKAGHGLSWWDSPRPSAEDEKLRSKYAYSVITLVGFCERTMELCEAGIIEEGLIAQLLGVELAMLSSTVIDPLAECENDPADVLKLNKISKFLKGLDDKLTAQAPSP